MSEIPSILYIEDDAMSRQVMAMLLKRGMGYQDVTIWEDSEDFSARLERLPRKPTLILMDIHVPPHNGFEMFAMLRNHADAYYHSVPVVALTASVMNDEVAQLKALGLDGVISKPVSQQLFPQLLGRALQGEKVWYIR